MDLQEVTKNSLSAFDDKQYLSNGIENIPWNWFSSALELICKKIISCKEDLS